MLTYSVVLGFSICSTIKDLQTTDMLVDCFSPTQNSNLTIQAEVFIYCNEVEQFTYIGGCGIMNICIWRHLKEELVWDIDEWLRVVSNIMDRYLNKLAIPLRN